MITLVSFGYDPNPASPMSSNCVSSCTCLVGVYYLETMETLSTFGCNIETEWKPHQTFDIVVADPGCRRNNRTTLFFRFVLFPVLRYL